MLFASTSFLPVYLPPNSITSFLFTAEAALYGLAFHMRSSHFLDENGPQNRATKRKVPLMERSTDLWTLQTTTVSPARRFLPIPLDAGFPPWPLQ